MRRLSYLAVKAAVSVGVRPDRSGIKLTGKRGKCASRGPTRTQRREPLEETKRQIDHMLLAGLTSPSLEAVLGHISREAEQSTPNSGKICHFRQNLPFYLWVSLLASL